MRQKLIDDSKLLEMHREGKPQKEMAAFFNVSPVAVSKRLKRLLPQPGTILDKYDLTERERAFVIQKAKGKSNTQAALESCDATSRESAKAIGSTLANKPEVKQAIDEVMENCGLTRTYRVIKLKNHVDNRDPGISLKALDMSFKLDGSYAPEKHVSLSNINIGTEGFDKRYQEFLGISGMTDRPSVIDVTPTGEDE